MTGSIGTAVSTSFDRYARLVRRLVGCDVALVSLVEPERQVFAGIDGPLPPDVQEARETPLSHSFCQHVVADGAPLIVTDARDVARLCTNLAIPDLGVVAYAGWPLTDHDGTVIGSLCAIDFTPRDWTESDLESLEDLANACSAELSQRFLRDRDERRNREAHHLGQRSRVLLELSEGLSRTETLSDVATALQDIAIDHLGCLRAGFWLRGTGQPLTSADLPARAPGHAEPLTLVPPNELDWESATRHAVLMTDRSNPVGEALLRNTMLEFEEVAAQNEIYPHLATPVQIGEARAFLPLRARGRAFGTIALVWDDVRRFTDDDRATFAALALYVGQAISRALLLQERLDALVTLQSSLLPRLPEPEHLDLAARYRPAAQRDQVGGDWYDAVIMPSGATALMIGDVVGHDMKAAAAMGQLRNMLRALAWALDDAPSSNVARLDRAIDELDVDGMASLVYARIEEDELDPLSGRRVLRWTNAGHPPPLVVEADGSTRWLETPSADLMLGISPDSHRSDNRTTMEPGDTLLLYTDGLVERRHEDLDLGLQRLADSATAHHELPVTEFLDRILRDLGSRAPGDDVAVLAVRFQDPEPTTLPRHE